MKKIKVVKDVIIFYKKPKLKIGQKINEILSDNGFHKYATDVFVDKIEKHKNEYKVYLI